MKDKSEYAARMAAKLRGAMIAAAANKAHTFGKRPPRGSKPQHLPLLKRRGLGVSTFDRAGFRRGEGA